MRLYNEAVFSTIFSLKRRVTTFFEQMPHEFDQNKDFINSIIRFQDSQMVSKFFKFQTWLNLDTAIPGTMGLKIFIS